MKQIPKEWQKYIIIGSAILLILIVLIILLLPKEQKQPNQTTPNSNQPTPSSYNRGTTSKGTSSPIGDILKKIEEKNPLSRLFPKKPKEDNSKVASSLPESPLIKEWRASVEGKLVAKTANTFTLEMDNHRIVIDYLDKYTRIMILVPTTHLSLKEVALNSFLSGNVLIKRKNPADPKSSEKLIGEIFHVLPKKP